MPGPGAVMIFLSGLPGPLVTALFGFVRMTVERRGLQRLVEKAHSVWKPRCEPQAKPFLHPAQDAERSGRVPSFLTWHFGQLHPGGSGALS